MTEDLPGVISSRVRSRARGQSSRGLSVGLVAQHLPRADTRRTGQPCAAGLERLSMGAYLSPERTAANTPCRERFDEHDAARPLRQVE